MITGGLGLMEVLKKLGVGSRKSEVGSYEGVDYFIFSLKAIIIFIKLNA
jgi:hypothetical protein